MVDARVWRLVNGLAGRSLAVYARAGGVLRLEKREGDSVVCQLLRHAVLGQEAVVRAYAPRDFELGSRAILVTH